MICSCCCKDDSLFQSRLFAERFLCSDCYQIEEETYLKVIGDLEFIQISLAGRIKKWSMYGDILKKIMENPEKHMENLNFDLTTAAIHSFVKER